MKAWTRRRAAQAGLLTTGVALLLGVCAISFNVERELHIEQERVLHTLRVKNTIARLTMAMQRAEIGLRNYLQSDAGEFLTVYKSSVDEALSDLVDLSLSTADNPNQQKLLDRIKPLILERRADWEEGIRARNAGEVGAAISLLASPQARVTWQDLRAEVAEMDGAEERLLATRSKASAELTDEMLWLDIMSVAGVVFVAGLSIFLIVASFRERDAARKVLQDAKTDLEAAVESRTAYLFKANEELRVAGELLRGAVQSIPDAVLVVDQNGETLLSNPAADELFGTRDPVGSSSWRRQYQRFRPADGTPFPPEETPIGKASNGQAVNNLEIVLRHPSRNADVYLLANGRPILDSVGAMKAAVLVYRDMTETREAEARIRQLQKTEVIGQLTAGMAHDFNNILTVIIGLSEVLSETIAGQPELVTAANTIDEAAQRGAKTIQNLLAFARRQPLQPRSVDVATLLSDAKSILNGTLDENIEISIASEPDVWPAHADSAQLTTALLNLALNARDAMPDGGSLTIEAGNVYLDEEYAQRETEMTPGYYVLFAVSDSGYGIASENLPRVFEPFFTTKPFGEGTGLGLSMVFGFVKQSGGHIKVYSEQGYGTTVKMYLPRASERESELDEPVFFERGDNESILVVEDEDLVRDYLSAQLKKLGYQARAVSSAKEALSLVESGTHFDLLLTDVVLKGGMNGKELSEEIVRRRPGSRVLFTSGYTENAIIHQGRLDSGVHLLSKPYRRSTLARYLKTALRNEGPARP